MFPWSVMPIAGISSRCASASMGLTFAAPSSIEYSVWLCRCTKDREEEPLIGWPVYDRAPTDLGVSRCVSLPGCRLSLLCNRCRTGLTGGRPTGPQPITPQHPLDLGLLRQLKSELGYHTRHHEGRDRRCEPEAVHAC